MASISKEELWEYTKDIYPIHRSISGAGVRKTLKYFKRIVPKIKIKNFKSGTKVYDWTVPKEWSINEAYIECDKKKIIDFKKNNLHILGYSNPINKTLSYTDLKNHLYYSKKDSKAIPYRTNYYGDDWGFCVSYDFFRSLNKKKKYKVVIKSKKFNGLINYGECIIKGKSTKEIVLSTNICHPSMGNNETSGAVITFALSKFLNSKKNYYTYRILFLPETIGAIAYVNKNFKILKKNVIAGFQIICVGTNKHFSIVTSPYEDKLCDKIGIFALKDLNLKYKKYSYLDRGSDERQFCSPNINLPFCSIMRSKYGTYKEYHTSLDNLSFISKNGMFSSLEFYKHLIFIIENNFIYKNLVFGEPFLNKYNLRGSLGGHIDSKFEKNIYNINTKTLLDILSYMNGRNDLVEICKLINVSFEEAVKIVNILLENTIIKKIK